MIKAAVIIFLLTTNYLLPTTYSYALELESPRFKLDVEKPNIDIDKKRSIVYTIESLQGAQAFKRFKSNGYVIKSHGSEDDLIFLLSPSIVDLGEISPGRNTTGEITLSVTSLNDLDYNINLIQEYPFKNLSGDTIPLDFLLEGEKSYRSVPNQNNSDPSTVIMTKNSDQPVKIIFNINQAQYQTAGTYETVIDFVAIPSY